MIFSLFFIGFIIFSGAVSAANITVTPSSGLQNAINKAHNGDILNLKAGYYSEDNNLEVNKNISIIGHSVKSGETPDAEIGSWMKIDSDVDVTLKYLSFSVYGGAISNQGKCKVISCNLYDNNANSAGAIDNGGTLTVTNSVFTENTADYEYGGVGGAIRNNGNLIVNGSVFINNTATGEGGAIFNNGPCNLTNCTFIDNTAESGGAIWSIYPLRLSSCNFNNNSAYSGGAIFNEGPLTINHSTFNKNSASYLGGAIRNDINKLTVTSTTFYKNSASYLGGAIYNQATAIIHFNRIIGGYNDISGGGSSDALYNWWGTNFKGTNPKTAGRFGGSGVVTSWMILKLSANPTIIKNNGLSTITADLRYDNKGILHTEGYVPNASMKFKTTLGNIIQTLTGNGIVYSKLKSGTIAGTAIISAILDNQLLQTNVKVNDTIPPKLVLTSPKNGATGFSRTTAITVKFSENIKAGTLYNYITMKKLSTNSKVSITKTISGNTLYIKTSTRSPNTLYQVTIPSWAVKDYAGNRLTSTYSFKFKTGS